MKKYKSFALLFVAISSLTLFAGSAWARNYGISYGAKSWNKDPKTVDSAHVIFRDRTNGKIVKILLEETEPDSSIFSGSFSINWDTSGKKMEPEIFIPEKETVGNLKALEKMSREIQAGKLRPHPIVIKPDPVKSQIEVFDTDEQAIKARQIFQAEAEAKKKTERANLIKPKASEQTLEAAAAAAKEAAIAKMAAEAATNEALRLRMEQLEEQRMNEKREEMAKLAAAERANRRAQAEALSQKGIAAYQKGDFELAEGYFRKSVGLDPNNDKIYFMYGVSLYRVEKLDDALVALKLAKVDESSRLERLYYMGLIHYRLKEMDQAKAEFRKVRNAKHPVLSPSAAFYEGILFFSVDQLENAKKSFEFVLDTSSDPAMDQKAEEYIEKILQILQYRKMAAKKWSANLKTGFGYDSNILNSPENDDSAGSATNKGGLRYNLMGDVDHRFYFKPESELSGKVATTYIYSFDQTDFGTADPWIVTGTVPYTRKGVFESKKGYKLTVTPGLETIFMDYDNSGARTNILNTLMVGADLQVIMSDSWFSGYNVDIRSDDSQLSATADENADALKISIKKSETLFLDQSKKRALIGSLGYVLNDASGKNKTFNRIDFSMLYVAPLEKYKNMSWNGGVSAYLLSYPDINGTREDTNIAFNFGVSKILSEKWNYSVNGSLGNNSSTDDNYTYDKYTLTGLIGYSWSE